MNITKLLSLVLLGPAWLLFLISRLSPRDRNTLVFGVHTDAFSGNVKALFLTSGDTYTKIFVSGDRGLVKQLNNDGHRAYTRLSPGGIYSCLIAGCYVYSSYPSDVNFWLSAGARYINLWHGTPLKKIERDVSTGYYGNRNRLSWLYHVAAPYLFAQPHSLLVSSPYEEACFKTAFDVRDSLFVRAFPPRLQKLTGQDNHNKETCHILYAPTWRDDHSFKFSDHVNLEQFDRFLQHNDMTFSIKLHPSDKSLPTITRFSNITVISKQADIYGFLGNADIVVSDYSSIIFESIHMGKPIVLFCPDYGSYQSNSREFYIDPGKDLPLRLTRDQSSLEAALRSSAEENPLNLDNLTQFRHYPAQNDLLDRLVEKAYR